MAKVGVKTAPALPEFKLVSLGDINPPELAARIAMDETLLNELAESIQEVGLIQPITLIKRGKRFEICAGHRRFLACRIAGRKDAPCLIYQNEGAANEAVKLHENLHREDLSDAEQAIFFAELVDKHGYTEAQLCAAVKQKPNYIADRLRLLSGDQDVFEALKQRQIRFSVARELNKITDHNFRKMYLQTAIDADPPARVVMQWVASWRLSAQPLPEAVPGEVGAPVDVVPAVAPQCCELCGGDKDPWNFVYIRVHKWEWEQLQAQLARPPKEAA